MGLITTRIKIWWGLTVLRGLITVQMVMGLGVFLIVLSPGWSTVTVAMEIVKFVGAALVLRHHLRLQVVIV